MLGLLDRATKLTSSQSETPETQTENGSSDLVRRSRASEGGSELHQSEPAQVIGFAKGSAHRATARAPEVRWRKRARDATR
jgi:hypothetical protein